MSYEQKNGQFVCFQKESKKTGRKYFNGETMLDGKAYWVSIFEKVSVKGDRYLSGVLEEKKTEPKPIEQKEKENDDWLNNEVPF